MQPKLHSFLEMVFLQMKEEMEEERRLCYVAMTRAKEKLTLTDYDIISRMARREKLIAFRNRQKDPANNYELRSDNHQRVKAIADKLGITPRRALNKILDDFFALTAKQAQFGTGKASKPGKE